MGEWIKSILVFTIFFSVVLYIMPSEKYKKYIQTAIGFVMIIVVINPIVRVLGFSDNLSFNIRYEIADLEYISSEDAYYRDVVAAIIRDELEKEYDLHMQVQVYMEENKSIRTIELSGESVDLETENDIRQNLSLKYGINEDMIIIY
ncbi:MAG: stage III sporulation protein AF [Coprococcus sp.]|nr:stage III sporulation protein AF [Coprococcus sp.]